MDRAERRRQARQDEQKLASGIDLTSPDREPVASLTRHLHGLFEKAKQTGGIEAPVRYLHSQITATAGKLKDIKIACAKGCSHCCHSWVSVTAPEVLYVARAVRKRGAMAADRVASTHAVTGLLNFTARQQQPIACPQLVDNACSIYEDRPTICRFTASGDAAACERAYWQLSGEDIPRPRLYLMGRNIYAVALAGALRRAGLPFVAYEFNTALACALAMPDPERAWLSGQDIFADVPRDPVDVFTTPAVQAMYNHTFAD